MSVAVYEWEDLSLRPDNTKINGVNAIQQAVNFLFLVRPGELLFSEIGFDIEDLHFEQATTENSTKFMIKLARAISMYDPRIRISVYHSKIEPLPRQKAWRISLFAEIFNENGYLELSFVYFGLDVN